MFDEAQKKLQSAIWDNDLVGCKAAFKLGADLNQQFQNKDLPFLAAVDCDRLEICTWMIENGVDPATVGPTLERNGLFFVRSLSMCEFLLGHGLDANTRDKFGKTPLFVAASIGRIDIAQMLLEHGAEQHATDRYGWTILHSAISSRYSQYSDVSPIEMCRFLMSLGVRSSLVPEGAAGDFMTPFQHAVKNGYDDLVELFCREGGEDPAQRTLAGRTMQQVAYRYTSTRDLLKRLRMEYSANSGIDQGHSSSDQPIVPRAREMAPL